MFKRIRIEVLALQRNLNYFISQKLPEEIRAVCLSNFIGGILLLVFSPLLVIVFQLVGAIGIAMSVFWLVVYVNKLQAEKRSRLR